MVRPSVAADPEPTAETRAHFAAGVSALRAENWSEAYREFKEAYAITPRWTILGNLGIAAEKLERIGEAIDSMMGYLERGGSGIDAKEAAAIRRTISHLEKESARITLEAPGSYWIVDTRTAGTPVVNEYGPLTGSVQLRVQPGQHTFRVARGVEAPAWSGLLLAGDTATHSFTPAVDAVEIADAPPTEPERDIESAQVSHVASYVLWGSGAAAGIAATIMAVHAGGLQQDSDSEFASRCPSGATGNDGCESTTDADRAAAHWRTGALVTGVGALGAIVTGTVLFFLNGSAPSSRRTEARIQPLASPTVVGLRGAF